MSGPVAPQVRSPPGAFAPLPASPGDADDLGIGGGLLLNVITGSSHWDVSGIGDGLGI